METFITELSSVIKNCPDAKTASTSLLDLTVGADDIGRSSPGQILVHRWPIATPLRTPRGRPRGMPSAPTDAGNGAPRRRERLGRRALVYTPGRAITVPSSIASSSAA
ncbi:hypothetical protein IFM12275_16110 [Nocardia sputorum]|uniref:Uncharacterized protein n=1 Tax=Nocardia sputorum TaxID=2984338 RepID=A0ABM8CYW3_9NOCA|nr:hypothetical protein IFM12275_16110 [Nocardia sputorum]BDU00159.1 hypothetical protein IFM12276_31870 [Nocardia sputorum]